jgi:hypothetical protein
LAAEDIRPPTRPSSASHSGPAKTEDKETGNAEVDVQAFPVQVAALAQDLNRTHIAARRAPQVWYQFHWQSDRYAVRKLDLQCVLAGAILDEPNPRLCLQPAMAGAH